jgi:hypothetical protein
MVCNPGNNQLGKHPCQLQDIVLVEWELIQVTLDEKHCPIQNHYALALRSFLFTFLIL